MPPARESRIEHHDLVADRRQIARDRQRRRACADAGDALAVALIRGAGDQRGDVLLVIGGDALEPADGDRLFLKPSAAAGGLARTVAGASQNPREHIRLPIDHIGGVVIPRGDLADIFGDRGVRRTRPLTVDDFVKVVRIGDVGRLHAGSSLRPFRCQRFGVHVFTSYANLRTKLLKSAWKATKGREVGIGSPFLRQARAQNRAKRSSCLP